MQVLIKVIISLSVIIAATAIGKKLPSAAGLIAVMPLTGALVLVWVYLENNGDPQTMQNFAKGAQWGILPTMLFYLVAISKLDLSMAYPMVSLNYAIILFISRIFFKENVTPLRWLGVVFIIFGVFLISRSG